MEPIKKIFLSFWKKMSLGQKLGLIGSASLIASLFMPWFSDVDVYRSGDVYLGLTGPLYLLGFSMLALGITGLVFNFNVKWLQKVGHGKLQMASGFGAMYLLIITNSVYFHPAYGLNVLAKKTEIGVVFALFSTVMVCTAGFIAFQKNRSKLENEDEMEPTLEYEQIKSGERVGSRQSSTAENPVERILETRKSVSEASGASKFPEQNSKAYEQMKRLMEKDTLSATQRMSQKKTTTTAFLGNNPTQKFDSSPTATAGAKPAQAYRMDL